MLKVLSALENVDNLQMPQHSRNVGGTFSVPPRLSGKGATLDEKRDRSVVSIERCGMQCRPSCQILRIDIGTGLQKCNNRFNMPGAAGDDQRAGSHEWKSFIGVMAILQKIPKARGTAH